jgi:8-oxo-dGTP pyrophosphatase MutT (NUDIX family)
MQPDNSELLAKMSYQNLDPREEFHRTSFIVLSTQFGKGLVGRCVAVSRTTPSTPQNAPAQKHELLILHRPESEDTLPGYWEIPGGHIEPHRP